MRIASSKRERCGGGFALRLKRVPAIFFSLVIVFLASGTALAGPGLLRVPLKIAPGDVIPTGNEWIALPTIRASDGALENFNVLSMQHRGLLQVTGGNGAPALQPYFEVNGKAVPFLNPAWELIEYWIPTAQLTVNGVKMTLTYCAPMGSRGAFLRMTVTNESAASVRTTLGLRASWGALDRVTYTPTRLRGERTIEPAPWVSAGEVFSFITHDTIFAWSLLHPGAQAQTSLPPLSISPEVDAQRIVTLAPGASAQQIFVLGAGIEEFSADHNAKALRERIDRYGARAMIERTAQWCKKRTRTTGKPWLDMLMNRNFLFTDLYAWGKTIDTEQFVGVTSRSPRYYVAAAYWDRDAMLWSFPALLDTDTHLAREALTYALTIQLRNTGIHSRFIDGVVLEDGYELDEGAAPIVALSEYVNRTGDIAFLRAHRKAVAYLRDRLLGRMDPKTGLYSSLQDPQDEFQKLPFLIYDNVLTWRALLDLSSLYTRLGDAPEAREMKAKAESLRAAILKYGIAAGAPGAGGPIFACATDGKHPLFSDVPPGSLLKLPALGFVSQDDPVFVRTYDWLHSKNYKYSYSGKPYGLPGSYRLPFTTSWSIADHLRLQRGRALALKILRTSPWDGGIISEGVHPGSAAMEQGGGAFATAAGYVAHVICEEFCQEGRKAPL
jgi:hypothetical protein